MRKQAYKFLAAGIFAVASMFVLTGSYFLLNKPEIPAELRKKAN